MCALFVLATSACQENLPEAREISRASTADPGVDVTTPEPADTAAVDEDPDSEGDTEALVVDVGAPLADFDHRLLGTNVAAWLSADRFELQDFQDALVASGAGLVRMPGGSWSNSYDWLACEMGDEEECHWTWAARPSDFATLLSATGLPGMWTVSINETAEHSAALVAFFNGDVEDRSVIGVDREGFDWGTVGDWATLRAEHGHPDPVGIDLWEVGNEVYAAKREVAGDGCTNFGWEDVWTCDGKAYVVGVEDHDGYLAIRDAMRRVDPTILVGAVGVPDPNDWGGWGTDVVDAAGSSLDFYIIHKYGFDASADVPSIVERPRRYWPQILDVLTAMLGPEVPIALTEHNLVAVPDRDTAQTMTHASNAVFLAETIGQLALKGVPIANQWDFAGGEAESGTNYGLVHADTLGPFPAFFAFSLWSRFGDVVLPVSGPSGNDSISAYAGRLASGDLTLIVVNRSADARSIPVELSAGRPVGATVDTLAADDPASTEVTYNGVAASSTAVLDTPGTSLEPDGATLHVEVPAWSVNLVQIVTDPQQ